ncbi:MAG: hypothetical protein M5U34_16610 [Chloroflexi bacterium]|nr:hypothetical protein [Chloroflexota bacterium]
MTSSLECFDVNLPDGSSFNICPGLGNPEEQTRYSLETANVNAAAAQAGLNALLSGQIPMPSPLPRPVWPPPAPT